MNLPNALVFASIGWIMEMIPKAFPSWFPHAGSGADNVRAVWLALMGAVQMSLGFGYVTRMHVIPVLARMVALVPSAEPGTLQLPSHRVVTLR